MVTQARVEARMIAMYRQAKLSICSSGVTASGATFKAG